MTTNNPLVIILFYPHFFYATYHLYSFASLMNTSSSNFPWANKDVASKSFLQSVLFEQHPKPWDCRRIPLYKSFFKAARCSDTCRFDISTNKSRLSNVENDHAAIKDDISTNKSRLSTVESNVEDQQANIDINSLHINTNSENITTIPKD